MLRLEVARLRREVAPARLELEQHGLRRLACEPEVAPGRVVAEALGRDRRHGRVEQRLERDDGELVDELLHLCVREHGEAPEARLARSLQQLEPGGGIGGENRRRSRPERRGDRTLGARRDLERAEHELCSLLGERAGGRRKPFLLREHPLHGERSLAGQPGTLCQALALTRRLAGPKRRLVGDPLELGGVCGSRIG